MLTRATTKHETTRHASVSVVVYSRSGMLGQAMQQSIFAGCPSTKLIPARNLDWSAGP
jgi:hypothetical protein